MARSNTQFAVDQGPSKFDLMLSLFDTEQGARTVRFQVGSIYATMPGRETSPLDVQIVSARRRHISAKIWDIEGIIETDRGKKRVSIYYLSDTREGRMRIEENLRTEGIMETPSESRKAKTLMIVIEKMIARYRNRHSGDLDEDIFKLFEKAKAVSWAEDRYSLDRAIENV